MVFEEGCGSYSWREMEVNTGQRSYLGGYCRCLGDKCLVFVFRGILVMIEKNKNIWKVI